MKTLLKRKAFTMIELLFVIVIMGIVGGIALEAIRQYYNGIYKTITTTKRVIEADHILDQLSKYFENAISSSIVNLDQDNTEDCYGPPVSGDNHDYTVAFVGVDHDSLRGISGRPGWSEEGGLLPNNELNVLDANLTVADNIIMDLYPNSDLAHSALYDSDSVDVNACTRFRWKGNGKEGYHTLSIGGFTETRYFLDNDNNATNGHRKYLLRTGYAFRVQDNGNFNMYSNFRPWVGERYAGTGVGVDVKTSLLGQNVAHFYADYDAHDFAGNVGVNDRGLVWTLKVCMRGLDTDLKDSDENATQICRERRVHVRY
jgi:prepilin-type N-terminal cleavage/methylation domain-containing protein